MPAVCSIMSPPEDHHRRSSLAGPTSEELVPVTRRVAVGLMLGLGGTVGLGLGSRIQASPGTLALWVADRAGHRVFGLDDDGIVRCSFPVAAPVVLRPRGASGLWAVQSAAQSRPDGPMEELIFGVEGVVLARRPWPAGGLREWTQGHPGPDVPQPEPGEPGHLWTVQNAGHLTEPTLFDLAPQGVVQHLCRWLRRGGTWERAFHLQLPFRTRAFAPGSGGVWVGDEERCRLWFVTRRGSLAIDKYCRDADGIDALSIASRASGGGVWAAAGGAIVRLDRRGSRMPGQGGFLHVVDLCAATLGRGGQ